MSPLATAIAVPQAHPIRPTRRSRQPHPDPQSSSPSQPPISPCFSPRRRTAPKIRRIRSCSWFPSPSIKHHRGRPSFRPQFPIAIARPRFAVSIPCRCRGRLWGRARPQLFACLPLHSSVLALALAGKY
ncbi:hypothetical protein EJB05_16306, partial [Eragrostis curvula]